MQLSRNRNTTNLLWFGLLGLVVICFMALIFEAIKIERGLHQKVSGRVDEAGYRRVSVEARGRDILLDGHVSSHQATDRVVSLVSSVAGVRVVKPALKVAVLRLPHLRITATKAGLFEFTGELPDQAHADLLAELLGSKVVNSGNMNITIEPETGEPEWIVAAARSFIVGKKVDNLEIEIGAGKISFAGRTVNPEFYQDVMDGLVIIASENGLQLINRLALLPSSS